MMKRKFLFLVVFIAAFVAYAQTGVLQKHEVQSGETLYSIARRYNVSEELLQKKGKYYELYMTQFAGGAI